MTQENTAEKALSIITSDNSKFVDARELHQFLEIKSRFNDWITNQIRDFEFVKNKDFRSLTKNLVNGGKTKEYQITLSMAKELSMLARNDKGKEARKYFIACETVAKAAIPATEYQIPQSFSEALQLAADIEKEVEILRLENLKTSKELTEAQPKIVFTDSVTVSKDTILIGKLSKFLKQNGINIGRNRLFQYLRDEGYLIKGGSDYNDPTQKSMNMGIFVIEENVKYNNGVPNIFKTTKVTGKGQVYFINKFLKASKQEPEAIYN